MNSVAGVIGGLIVGATLGAGAVYVAKSPKATAPTPTPSSSTPAAQSAASPTNTTNDTQVLFELDGKPYTEKDLGAETQAQTYDIRHESYERLATTLTQIALQKSLAKEKGKESSDPLPPLEELVDVGSPTDEEAKSLYEANKARFPEGTSFEQLKPDINRYLKSQKLSDQIRTKSEELKASQRFKLLLPAPISPKVTIDISPFTAKGPASAANTLVEVADYLCPHCQAAAEEMDQIVKDLGDKVRFVPVPYSLRNETLSGALARGAFCAKQQGDEAFWKFHEAAFRIARTKGWKITDPDSKEPVLEVAKESQVDVAKIESCLATPEAAGFVTATAKAMQKIGVTGTPTFFLNGQKIHVHGKPLREAITSQMVSSH
jgi:protein-disulfide isomerase